MAVPVWDRIWLRASDTLSAAISTSRMRDSVASMFTCASDTLPSVPSRRFCTAPTLARMVDTASIAAAISARAVLAPSGDQAGPGDWAPDTLGTLIHWGASGATREGTGPPP